MPPGLFFQPFLGIDQQDGLIRGGRPGDHVFDELPVPGSIDDLKRPSRMTKFNPRGVDRDVLRLLLKQRIQEEGVLKRHPLLPAGLFHRLQLPLRQGIRVRQQPANQGGFSVVHMAHHHNSRPRFLQTARGGRASHAFREKGRLESGRHRLGRRRHDDSAHRNPLARSFCMALRSW